MARVDVKSGDVVRLRGGGPNMTVISGTGVAPQVRAMGVTHAWPLCQWFNKTDELREAPFDPQTLVILEVA